MTMTGNSLRLGLSVLGFLFLPSVIQAEQDENARIIDEIRASLSQYVETFNRADAESLAQFWIEDATYTNSNGDQIVGRSTILDSFRQNFTNNPGIKMEAADTRIEPASNGQAYESGRDILTYANGTVEESSYTAVLKKVGERWLIQEVTDLGPSEPPPHYEHLKVLEWMIGSWKDEGDGMIVETTYEWSSSQNSIHGSFSIITDGKLEKDGIVVIGWDPIEQNIRSWTFDSEGGTAEAVWYEKDGKWFAKALHILPDGETGSSTRVFEKVDDKTLRWKAINREVDGELLPSIGPITLTRVENGKLPGKAGKPE
jgi:uncharacterized protein (TIGR02246 family)